MAWFGNKTPTTAIPVVIKKPYHEIMAKERDELHWFIKQNSHAISTEAYSKLREVEKVLAELNEFLKDNTPRAEDEYLLSSIMGDYIPTAITLFTRLPLHDQAKGSEADKLLISQCKTFEKDLNDRNLELHERVRREMRTQAAFIEERFTNPE